MKQRTQFGSTTAIGLMLNLNVTHCELVDSSMLVDDIEDSVVIGKVRLVIHCPFKCRTGAFKH